MKNLLKTIIFICVLVTSIVVYFDFTVNKLNKDYLVSYGRGFEHKFDKLKRVQSNKIVIVGGSNVNFGIDSDLMEISLGIPVVNMGLHAAFNTFNIIDPVTPYLKDGDILIISREFNEKLYGSSIEVSNYFEFMPLKAKWEVYKNFEAISPILKSHIQNSQKNIIDLNIEPQKTFKQGPYSAKAFKNDNIYKNVINFEMPKWIYEKFKIKSLDPPNNENVFQYYRDLKKDLNERGVKVYFSMPAIVKNFFSTEDITTYYKTLSKKTGIELLSPNTYEFPIEKLSNSMYHLNAVGRRERSLELSNEIARHQNIKLKSVKDQFFVSSTIANPTSLELNDFRQCKLVDNILTFNNYDDKKPDNYSRIKASALDDPFFNKYFKVVVEGEESLIKDLKFRAVGEPQEWDFTYMNDTKHVLIKNNIQGTVYKNGSAYLGISLNNINKYDNQDITIHQIEISETPFIVKSLVNLVVNNSMVIDSRNSDNELIIKVNDLATHYNISPNTKYILANTANELLITNLYNNETTSIKKTETNTAVTIQFPPDVLEVFELQ